MTHHETWTRLFLTFLAVLLFVCFQTAGVSLLHPSLRWSCWSHVSDIFILTDGHRRSGANNWSPGTDHPVTHDPSSWKATPVGIFWHLRPPGFLEPEKPWWELLVLSHVLLILFIHFCSRRPVKMMNWLWVFPLCAQGTFLKFISSIFTPVSTRSSTDFMACIHATLFPTCAPITAWRRTWRHLKRWWRWGV